MSVLPETGHTDDVQLGALGAMDHYGGAALEAPPVPARRALEERKARRLQFGPILDVPDPTTDCGQLKPRLEWAFMAMVGNYYGLGQMFSGEDSAFFDDRKMQSLFSAHIAMCQQEGAPDSANTARHGENGAPDYQEYCHSATLYKPTFMLFLAHALRANPAVRCANSSCRVAVGGQLTTSKASSTKCAARTRPNRRCRR